MNARLPLPTERIRQVAANDCNLEVKKIAILVFPGFSLTSLSSFLSPFKSFNAIRQKDIFRWILASECGRAARSDLGIDMPVGFRFSDFASSLHLGKKFDMLVLIADGPMPSAPISAELVGIIRRCVRQHVPVVALGSAPWLLAEAGLLDSKRCTIHWSRLAVFTETFRASRATDSIFVRDRAIWTCAGELAAFDVAVALLNEIASEDLSDEVCRRNLSDILRTEGTRQSGATPWNLPLAPEKLKQALELMIKNIDDPVPLARLASSINVSRRQLERQFVNRLGKSPYRYYLELRLERARQLVEGTTLPLVEIAVACGFVSPSHFSKSYREVFGCTPTVARRTPSRVVLA
jgi:transcriptional regulator GlxA family with amidase domain